MNYLQMLEARRLFEAGENVSQRLRKTEANPLDIVELVYDLQAGSYVAYAEEHRESLKKYAREMEAIARRYVSSRASVLDVGCGELTTLSFFLSEIGDVVDRAYGFDVSLSRLLVGKGFADRNMGPAFGRLEVIAAELQALPYRTASIDLCVSNHALEPNGGQEHALLTEIFRVTRGVVLLFEPYYEGASDAARDRMRAMGYVRDLENVARRLGADVLEVVPMTHVRSPLNPTACFVLRPPREHIQKTNLGEDIYSLPGTDLPLQRGKYGYISPDTGILFPTVAGIPILRKSAGVHASAVLQDFCVAAS